MSRMVVCPRCGGTGNGMTGTCALCVWRGEVTAERAAEYEADQRKLEAIRDKRWRERHEREAEYQRRLDRGW